MEREVVFVSSKIALVSSTGYIMRQIQVLPLKFDVVVVVLLPYLNHVILLVVVVAVVGVIDVVGGSVVWLRQQDVIFDRSYCSIIC